MFLERATSLCNWYKKLLLHDKHIVFGGFSVLLNSLSLSNRPSACLGVAFSDNCYLSDSQILGSISLNFALQVDFCS